MTPCISSISGEINAQLIFISFRYQEKLEEQENQFKTQQMKLVQEIQRDRENFTKEQAKREAEMEANLQEKHLQHQV